MQVAGKCLCLLIGLTFMVFYAIYEIKKALFFWTH